MWVIEVDILNSKKKEILQVLVVTTHVEYTKLTRTKIWWHVCVVNSSCEFRVATGAQVQFILTMYLVEKKKNHQRQ
jgi:hypothetical protein